MPAKLGLDTSERRCGGGCGSTFRMTDYPPGYFFYKKDVRRGSGVNTCRPCEIDKLRGHVKEWEGKISQESISNTNDDIKLLLTGKPVNETHRKNIRKVYGLET